MRLVAKCVWGACIATDIEDRDPLKVCFSQTMVEVLMLCSMSWVSPRLPDCCNLNDDFDSDAGVVGQGY